MGIIWYSEIVTERRAKTSSAQMLRRTFESSRTLNAKFNSIFQQSALEVLADQKRQATKLPFFIATVQSNTFLL